MKCETIIANQYVKKVVPLIESAKDSIDICVFDWRWYANDVGELCQKFNQSIVSAVRRGVKVRALVNSEEIAAPLRKVGLAVKVHNSARLLHLKMMIIDQKIVVTGSHNYSKSAFNTNYELSVILSDNFDVFEFSNFFQTLWQN